jgi:hypothetical protein
VIKALQQVLTPKGPVDADLSAYYETVLRKGSPFVDAAGELNEHGVKNGQFGSQRRGQGEAIADNLIAGESDCLR